MNMMPNPPAADTAAIDAFNRQARDEGWAILLDPACRFGVAKLHSALALWREQAASGIPFRKAMTARLLQPYIPMLSIFERLSLPDGSVRYRNRLMGTDAALSTIEMTGKYVEDMIPEPYLRRWHALGQAFFSYCGPLRLLFGGDTFNKHFLVGEGFAAPLLTDAGRPDIGMSIIAYDGIDSWSVVEARACAELGLK
jgi:hypothetical protein